MSKSNPVVVSICLVLLTAATTLHALETPEDAMCVCADGALGTGDYVSCLAKMTRRLVAAGDLDRAGRAELVAAASATDLDALDAFCADRGGAGDLEGYGTSLSVGTPFYPAASPSGPTSLALVQVRLWNFSPRDLVLVSNTSGPADGCLFSFRVLDDTGLVVRQASPAICLPALLDLELDRGEIQTYDASVPLVAEGSDPAAGVIDGEKLPDGIYQIEVLWHLSGPELGTGSGNFVAPLPTARVPIRIGS